MVQNWKLWLIFTVVASAIAAAIINTFDPHAMRLAMQAFGADGPPAGMGGGPFGTGSSRFGLFTIPDLMASGYYAMLGLIMPLVYVVVTANSLVASQIDRGSMAYTLSTPITRLKVVFTQAAYLIVALLAMFSLMVGVYAAAEYLDMEVAQLLTQLNILESDPIALAVAAEASGVTEETLMAFIQVQLAESEFEFDQGIYFNVANFLNLNIGIFLLMFAIGGVSFMFSCIFNLTRNSLALGAGIPFAFFILNMMAGVSPDFASLRFFTLNTLYNPMDVVSGYGFISQFIAMAAIGLALYVIGITVFKRKDLPL